MAIVQKGQSGLGAFLLFGVGEMDWGGVLLVDMGRGVLILERSGHGMEGCRREITGFRSSGKWLFFPLNCWMMKLTGSEQVLHRGELMISMMYILIRTKRGINIARLSRGTTTCT